MTAISDFLENELLDHSLGTGAYTSPSGSVYCALFERDPGDAPTATDEVTGGSYARQIATFNAAASGSATNDSDIDFTGMPATTVTHVALFDTDTSVNNMLYAGALDTDKTTNDSDTFRISAGQLTVSLD